MLSQNTYPIAIDIGSDAVYALQLQTQPEKLKIRNMMYQKLDMETIDFEDQICALPPILKRIKKDKQFKGRRVIAHIPVRKVQCFPVKFMVNKNQIIDEAIAKEVEKNLPYPLDEAVIDYPSIDYPSIGRTDPGQYCKVIVTAVLKKDIEMIMDVFNTAGLLLEVIDYRPVSFIRLHHHLFKPLEKPIIICHIGQGESSVQILNKHRILAIDKFDWGINHLISKLNTNLNFEDKKFNAINLLRKHGLKQKSQKKEDQKIRHIVSRIILPGVEELVFEFHKLLGYVRNKEILGEVQTIYLYGFANWIKDLDTYIEKRVNIPVRIMDTVSFDLNGYDEIEPFIPALGLAIRKVQCL
jgi:type IV pilus assembly protein PilM